MQIPVYATLGLACIAGWLLWGMEYCHSFTYILLVLTADRYMMFYLLGNKLIPADIIHKFRTSLEIGSFGVWVYSGSHSVYTFLLFLLVMDFLILCVEHIRIGSYEYPKSRWRWPATAVVVATAGLTAYAFYRWCLSGNTALETAILFILSMELLSRVALWFYFHYEDMKRNAARNEAHAKL